MKKLLIVGTILLTGALLVSGVFYPDYPLMWLASTSADYSVVRGVLIAILAVLLFSNPPRAVYFRIFLAACAGVLGIATIGLLLTYNMNLIDAIVFMEIAIIFAIEALESPDSYPSLAKMKHTNAAM